LKDAEKYISLIKILINANNNVEKIKYKKIKLRLIFAPKKLLKIKKEIKVDIEVLNVNK
tara:strand:+ start:90 stop:266 length:177 start_codon:yes stop_codon:yes gene_type:complete